MPKIVMDVLGGVNTSRGELQLPPGEVSALQNVRGGLFGNWSKREGVENVTSFTNPVLGIFDLEFDTITIPVFVSGSTLTFFPNTATASGSLPTADPYNGDDPLDPDTVRTSLLLIEPTMRAINERFGRIPLNGVTWPNRLFDSTGYIGPTGEAPATIAASTFYPTALGNLSMPVNNFYQYDLAQHDAYHGNPAGTRATALVNAIIDALDQSQVMITRYVRAIQGEASVRFYDNSTLPKPSAATTGTYRKRLSDCKVAVRKLTALSIAASQVNRAVKLVEGQSLVGCDAAKSTCQTNWNSASFTSPYNSEIRQHTREGNNGVTYKASVDTVKGQIQVDLSNYSSGTATIYLFLSSTGGYLNGLQTPTGTNNDVWGAWQSATVGGVYTSSVVTHSDTFPGFIGTCSGGIDTNSGGWLVLNQVAVVQPTMTYSV